MSDWIDLVGEKPAEAGPRDVAVFLDSKEKQLTETGRRSLRLGREWADVLGAYVLGVLVAGTEGNAAEAGAYGADKVVLCASLREFAEAHTPSVFLFPMTERGIEAASRVGEALQCSVLGPAFEASIDPSTGLVQARVATYGGKQIETLNSGEWRPQIIVFEPGHLPVEQEDRSRKAEILRL